MSSSDQRGPHHRSDNVADATYLSKNPTWHEEDSPWKAKMVVEILTRNGISPISVCDVGCGSGELLRQLSLALGDHVQFSGYEVSADAYSICKKKEAGNLSFYCEDILSKAAVFFDLLLCIDVIEHIEDYYGFLKRLRALSTYTVFHIPLDLSVQNIVRVYPLQRERKKVGHIHFFTKETALAALEHVGYEVVDAFITIGSVDLPARSWRSAIMKIPRRIMFSMSQDLTARILGGCSLMVLVRSAGSSRTKVACRNPQDVDRRNINRRTRFYN